jgi:hypothetical protein
LKSVSEMCYIQTDANTGRYLGSLATGREPGNLQRTTAMTIEILYLTAQIHRWLNRRVARHLAAQVEKLTR